MPLLQHPGKGPAELPDRSCRSPRSPHALSLSPLLRGRAGGQAAAEGSAWGRGVHGETGDGDAARQKAPKKSRAVASCGAELSAGGFPKCKTLPEQNPRVPLPRPVSRRVGLLPSWGSQRHAGCPGVMGTHGTAGARALAQSRERQRRVLLPAPETIPKDPAAEQGRGAAGAPQWLGVTAVSPRPPRPPSPAARSPPANTALPRRQWITSAQPSIHPPALSRKSQKD